MIEDLKTLDSFPSASFDLCVIGAGPAGITITNELRGSGLKICLVESGGLQEESSTHALFDGESVGHPMSLELGRHRVFGGAATRWGGRSAMLDPIDLQRRDWVENSGWPIEYGALKPYYERAKHANNFTAPWLSLAGVQNHLNIDLPQLTSGNIDTFVWRVASPDVNPRLYELLTPGYRPVFDWGKVHRTSLAAAQNVTVLLHANLTDFHVSPSNDHVEAITVKSLNGKSATIRARAFVLCCGGIENVRLLLNAPKSLLGSINRFDRIGRYFSQHPRGTIATVKARPGDAVRLQQLFNTFLQRRNRKVQYETGFALSEKAQRQHKLLNASAAFYYYAKDDTSWQAARRIRDSLQNRSLDGATTKDVLRVLGGAVEEIPNLVRRYVIGRQVIHRDPRIEICIDLEQGPDPDSRITLGSRTDALGMRRVKIDWRVSEKERRTARYFAEFSATELERLGFGKVESEDWLSSSDPMQVTDLRGTYHFLSGTRMSDDPRQGVVNRECRVHGSDNIYVAGTSVFSTGGHANPTLTIVALAIRLADHLRQQLGVSAIGRLPVSETPPLKARA